MNEEMAVKALFRLKKLGNYKFWLSVKETAAILGITKEWAWLEIDKGSIKNKIDVTRGVTKKYRLIHVKWIEQYINLKMVKNPKMINHLLRRRGLPARKYNVIDSVIEKRLERKENELKRKLNNIEKNK